MATTYDASLGSDKDWVRFLIGDRTAPMTLTDEEIDGIVDEQTSTGQALKYFAAADALTFLYGIFRTGRKGVVDRQISKLRLRYGEDVSAINAVNRQAGEFRRKGVFLDYKATSRPYTLKML